VQPVKSAQRHRSQAQAIAVERLASMARSHLLTGEHSKACCQAGEARRQNQRKANLVPIATEEELSAMMV
jgi:hypothetical protein